jgi:GTPase SAR1 family protein
MNSDLKIVFAGPPQSGKTELADLISAVSKAFQGNTKPTVCLRILEFSTTIEIFGMQTTISAQIWDTSGEEKYSQTWPAIAYKADGVVLVYNAYDKTQGRAIENYAKHFAKDVQVQQVLLIAHKIGESDQKPLRAKLPKPIETAQIAIVDAKESLDEFNNAFNRFLERVQQAKVKRVEESERALIGESPAKEDGETPDEGSAPD